jgi:hypothetical protein
MRVARSASGGSENRGASSTVLGPVASTRSAVLSVRPIGFARQATAERPPNTDPASRRSRRSPPAAGVALRGQAWFESRLRHEVTPRSHGRCAVASRETSSDGLHGDPAVPAIEAGARGDHAAVRVAFLGGHQVRSPPATRRTWMCLPMRRPRPEGPAPALGLLWASRTDPSLWRDRRAAGTCTGLQAFRRSFAPRRRTRHLGWPLCSARWLSTCPRRSCV